MAREGVNSLKYVFDFAVYLRQLQISNMSAKYCDVK